MSECAQARALAQTWWMSYLVDVVREAGSHLCMQIEAGGEL